MSVGSPQLSPPSPRRQTQPGGRRLPQQEQEQEHGQQQERFASAQAVGFVTDPLPQDTCQSRQRRAQTTGAPQAGTLLSGKGGKHTAHCVSFKEPVCEPVHPAAPLLPVPQKRKQVEEEVVEAMASVRSFKSFSSLSDLKQQLKCGKHGCMAAPAIQPCLARRMLRDSAPCKAPTGTGHAAEVNRAGGAPTAHGAASRTRHIGPVQHVSTATPREELRPLGYDSSSKGQLHRQPRLEIGGGAWDECLDGQYTHTTTCMLSGSWPSNRPCLSISLTAHLQRGTSYAQG